MLIVSDCSRQLPCFTGFGGLPLWTLVGKQLCSCKYLTVITLIGSVSANLVRNIIFDELLRVDRSAPICVNQVHRHSVVNLIVQQVIAPAINYQRRVSEVDQVDQENSCPIESLSTVVGYPWVRSKLVLIPPEFFV